MLTKKKQETDDDGPRLLLMRHRRPTGSNPLTDVWVVPMSRVKDDDLRTLARVNRRSGNEDSSALPFAWTDAFVDLCDCWAEFYLGTCSMLDAPGYLCYASLAAFYVYSELPFEAERPNQLVA